MLDLPHDDLDLESEGVVGENAEIRTEGTKGITWSKRDEASTGEGRGMPVSVREAVAQINWGGTRRRGKDSVGFEGLRPKSFKKNSMEACWQVSRRPVSRKIFRILRFPSSILP